MKKKKKILIKVRNENLYKSLKNLIHFQTKLNLTLKKVVQLKIIVKSKEKAW